MVGIILRIRVYPKDLFCEGVWFFRALRRICHGSISDPWLILSLGLAGSAELFLLIELIHLSPGTVRDISFCGSHSATNSLRSQHSLAVASRAPLVCTLALAL